MEQKSNVKYSRALIVAALAAALSGCGVFGGRATDTSTKNAQAPSETVQTVSETEQVASMTTANEAGTSSDANANTSETTSESASSSNKVTLANSVSDGVLDTSDLFTERDLEQTADLSGAENITVVSGQDIVITEAGTYVLSGSAENATITVNVDSSEKVQLVLNGLSINNQDFPAIYVTAADKVFITTVEGSQNTLTVSGSFVADGETNTDATIFSKDDLVFNGLGTLTVNSTSNGITGKDDVKFTGGTYVISSEADAIEANDSIRMAGGTFTIATNKDGLHAENDEDDTVGYIYVCGATLDINAAGDAMQAATYVQIDDGTITAAGGEAIEGTYVQINGGVINISAYDDGINASYKSNSIGDPVLEIRGGEVTINMAQGDTDALDSNGYLYVRGGTVNINAQFAFDFDYGAELTGGTVYVNGEQVSEITNSMMMGGGMGGPGMGGPGMGW